MNKTRGGDRWKQIPPAASAETGTPNSGDSVNLDSITVDPEMAQPVNPAVSAALHSGRLGDGETTMSDPDESPQVGSRVPNLVLANSWIISLIIHLGLLILLSLVSYSLHQGTELEIQLSNSAGEDPTFMIESEDSQASDGSNLDSEMEQLLAASAESAAFEVNSEPLEFDPQFSLDDLTGKDKNSSDSIAGLIRSERRVGNGNQAKFFGIQASGKDFVFIVDSSGSMGGHRWKNAKRELKNSLGSLQENQRFYVIFFDHQTHLMFQGRVDRYRKSRRLKMVHASAENLTRVNNWLRRVDLGKLTRPRVSFDYGLSLEPDAIFFLTDGEFNDGTYEYLMGIAAQSSQLPTIHTVAFGNPIAGRTLEEIASRFQGKYRFVR